jgi:hypothetical protein
MTTLSLCDANTGPAPESKPCTFRRNCTSSDLHFPKCFGEIWLLCSSSSIGGIELYCLLGCSQKLRQVLIVKNRPVADYPGHFDSGALIFCNNNNSFLGVQCSNLQSMHSLKFIHLWLLYLVWKCLVKEKLATHQHQCVNRKISL